jgi:hypothetical protein
MLEDLIKARDEAYEQFSISGSVKDKGLYNRAMRALATYVEENNLDYKPIDLFDNEPYIIKKHNKVEDIDVYNIDDSPDLIDEILDGID